MFLIIVNSKKYLVVGGYRGSSYFSSTETWSLGDSSWTTVSPLPRTATVCFAVAVNLNNKIYLFGKFRYVNDLEIFKFSGNSKWYRDGGLTSDADQVYEWNGDKEEWTVHGKILERRSHVGVSLVPLSSGLLDHCTP